MNENRIRDVVIAGGGTAGWMAAGLFANTMGKSIRIKLVESDAIGVIGVGEATIPPIQVFNRMLGIDENEFMRATNATIKLGIEFQNWGGIGESYLHGFGYIGKSLGILRFEQYWLKSLKNGSALDIENYSFTNLAARAGKFARMHKIQGVPLDGLGYAFHFDAALYAKFLRAYAEKRGVERTEGKIYKVNTNGESGHITSVELADGTEITGDFFIDCSGFRGLLIDRTVGSEFEDWTHWLMSDRAIAVPSENERGLEPRPYTQSIAHSAGWQWRIPLQHRTGNGHVFSSAHMSEDEATSILLYNLEGKPLKEPMTIRFKTGYRPEGWKKNCVAIGLSSGFIEPLESTSIHLIQIALFHLLKMFPTSAIEPSMRDEYNRRMQFEYSSIRDFIILHYHVNQRTDSDYWKTCREMEIPETVQRKIEAFRTRGHLYRTDGELFTEEAWTHVMLGQNLIPQTYNPLADNFTDAEIAEFLANINMLLKSTVAKLPSHQQFIDANCKAPAV